MRIYIHLILCVIFTIFLLEISCQVVKYETEEESVPDEYIITLKDNIVNSKAGQWAADFAKRIKDKYGCLVRRKFKFNKIHAFRVHGLWDKIQKIKALKEVAYVEKNIYVKVIQDTPSILPNESIVCIEENTGRNLWGLSRISRRDKIPLILGASYKWGSNDDGEGVDAYIMDTGIDLTHPDFEGRARWGYTASTILEEEQDFHGHGTHVAGTVGGRIHGVAKRVNLVAIKVLNADGVGSMGDVIEGIEWAYQDMTAKQERTGQKPKVVLNLSLGGEGRLLALEQIMEQATQAGMIFVVAAGNEYDDACLYTPANIGVAITVGATNINDKMGDFSNYGSCVDILAPGEAILSAFPGGGTALLQGTSMASPHVAGAVARYLSRYTTPPSPDNIKQMMDFDSTKDKITLQVGDNPTARLTTPNKLLYMTCGSPSTLNSATILKPTVIIVTVMISYFLT